MATVTMKGNPVETAGELPAVGAQAPNFNLVNGDLQDVSLSDFAGQRKVINIVPSLDTPTCQTQTRTFNQRAAGLDNTQVLVVSGDLPFAQKRFCEAEGIERVEPLSMMRDKRFAEDYGVLLKSGPLAGLTARAVLVLDENDKVLHGELVAEVGNEPDYDAALAALQ